MTREKDRVVLNFYDSLLRESDLEILKGPRWFNDSLISFYFEYLGSVRFKTNTSMLFVSPQVTQCIKITPVSEIGIFLDPLQANKKKFLFFALNDNETARSGGSHWSLLVYSRPETALYHFDSNRGANESQAYDFGQKVLSYLGLAGSRPITEVESLQQTNGYDCGLFVVCNSELVGAHVNQYHRVAGCGLLERSHVINKRKEILQLIESLKNYS